MNDNPINILREAAPYVQKHRDNVFVLYLDSGVTDTLDQPATEQLIADIALLHCFAIRLVVVFGIRTQLNRALGERGMPSSFGDHDDWRVTTEQQLQLIEHIVRQSQTRIVATMQQSLLRYGVEQSHFDVLTDQRLVLAKPYGVQGGIDYQFTGVVNKIQAAKIQSQLQLGSLILISPMTPSNQGQFFNLRAIEIALASASALEADKLIVIGRPIPAIGSRSFFHAEEFYRAMDEHTPENLDEVDTSLFKRVVSESIAHRIGRIHFIDHQNSNSLLTELFTHEGNGLLISCDPYEQFRTACLDDIDRILALYQPAQEKDEIVVRDSAQISADIQAYHLLLCDQIVIGVAALSPIANSQAVEMHGLAIDPQYRQQGRGKRLALSLIEKARQAGYQDLFALTTQAQHFFIELGMALVDINRLPKDRSQSFQPSRGSKIYHIALNGVNHSKRDQD